MLNIWAASSSFMGLWTSPGWRPRVNVRLRGATWQNPRHPGMTNNINANIYIVEAPRIYEHLGRNLGIIILANPPNCYYKYVCIILDSQSYCLAWSVRIKYIYSHYSSCFPCLHNILLFPVITNCDHWRPYFVQLQCIMRKKAAYSSRPFTNQLVKHKVNTIWFWNAWLSV